MIPKVAKEIQVPLVAAGGIATGRAMLAVMNLGADGVQIGSRFIASKESSAHESFKNSVLNTDEGGTMLTLKELTPVRLIKNAFYQKLEKAYDEDASVEELNNILGRGRAKKGMFEGDLEEGELEVGQVASLIEEIKPASEIIHEIITEFRAAINEQNTEKFNF